MGLKQIFTEATFATYIKAIKSPREVIYNRKLLLTVALYATSGIPISSSSSMPSLPGFQHDFGITSATNPTQVSSFISFVYMGAGIGSGLSLFLNDRIGRLWAYRLYMAIWIVGQIITTASMGNLGVLYFACIVSGLGILELIVTGPASIVEIVLAEVRSLLAVWFSVAMLLSLTVSVFTVYASFLHVAVGQTQYQVVFFAPTIVMKLFIMASFLLYESPRGNPQPNGARGLPIHHPRVAHEVENIKEQIVKEEEKLGRNPRFTVLIKDAFQVPPNLRRFQQAVLSYALAQLSGANSVTFYLVPISFLFTLSASFLFIDALGHRRSLFTGIAIQIISDVYIGVFVKYRQAGSVAPGSGEAAIAAVFIHGIRVSPLVLPYVPGAKLWLNHLRSFGSAFAQFFHWLFFFGVNKGMPSLLSWCFLSLMYVYCVVPETSLQGLEQLDELFKGP
ncbi:MFS general substrate transporter [Colletotrichum caudatum]|nr:MFS general substrate transporter [Colletotrichum caudatum]